jgi:MFS family permease
MVKSLGPVAALLMGTFFLLAGSGLIGILLPLRGQAESFPTTSLGLLGTAWAGGFIAGCLLAPHAVRSVGHIRAFAAFAAVGAIVALANGIFVVAPFWIVMRVATGFAMAGCVMIIESWLNERSTNENRGTVFAVYMMVTYGAITAGQMLVATGNVMQATLFMVTGIFYCFALIPTALSTAASPRPLLSVKLDLRELYRHSPISVAACLLIGIANGSWGTLGPVFGARVGMPTPEIAVMMSLTVVAGGAMQLPVGRLSDRMDRRYVLAGVAVFAALAGLAIFLVEPRNPSATIAMTVLYGGAAYTLYSVAVAHANDHADAESFVRVSGGLLLLYGFGTMAGPLISAGLMDLMRPESVFLTTMLAHSALAAYAIYRSRQRAAVPQEEKEAFKTLPAERTVTPEGLRLDPRGEGDLA